MIAPNVLLYAHIFFHIDTYLGLKEPKSNLTDDIYLMEYLHSPYIVKTYFVGLSLNLRSILAVVRD